jgi:hypothetical protein
VSHLLEIAFEQSAFHGPVHDARGASPAQPQQQTRLLHAAGGPQHAYGKRFKHECELALRLRPWDVAGLHTTLRTLRAGCRGDQHGFELYRVQVPPGPHRCVILARPVFPAVGTAHRLFRVVPQQNPDLLLIHREFDIHNLPGLVEDQHRE